MKSKNSYAQILKSSSVMGGAALLVMLFGFLRTKFAAVLLGTTGVGLMASLNATQSVASTIFGLGLGASAVREIAVAVTKGDEEGIGNSFLTLKRICLTTGILGMCLMVVSSRMISQVTFGSDEYDIDIAALGFVVLISNLSAIYQALLQGTRRVREMALANVNGAIIGTVASVPLYYFFGLRGVVPGIVASSVAQLFFLRRYALKIKNKSTRQTFNETVKRGRKMIGLGFSLMWSSLLVCLDAYFIIYLINITNGVKGVGLYSAAFVLSGALVNFVLNAMGADYYPRLTEVSSNREEMCALVNQQIETGLLLTTAGLLGGIVFSPFLIDWFYSSEFNQAVPLLQWFILGCLGRVISWPMGFVILAMGKSSWFLLSETLFNLCHLAMVAFGLWFMGIEGVAFGYCVAYVIYGVGLYLFCKKHIGFDWNVDCRIIMGASIALLITAMVLCRTFPFLVSIAIGAILLGFCVIYSFWHLYCKVLPNSLFFNKVKN